MKTRRMVIPKLLLVACGAIASILPPAAPGRTPAAASANDALTSWLRQSAIPLSSVTAGSGFADLEPLRDELRNVRIVGLGEATHGTREFFQLKHRLVEFLVRELGFTVLALEIQYHKCLPVNAYVLGDATSDDPAALLRENLPGIYQTEEVLALVEWMRAYNQTVPDERKVRFAGFDVQLPHRAADAVRSFVRRVAPDELPRVEALMAETAPPDFRRFWLAYGERTAARKARLRKRLLELLGSLVAREARFVRMTSRAEYDAAVQSARILVQSDEVRSVPEARKQTVDDRRDRNMADTVDFLLERERPGARAILWAHNFHLWTMQPGTEKSKDAATRAGLARHGLLFKPMGQWLREAYGAEYYAFGFVFDRGSFQAVAQEAGDDSMEPLEFSLGPSPNGSLAWQLDLAGLGDCILPLRRAPADGPVDTWLRSPQGIRFAGAEFSRKWKEPDYTVLTVPREQFDGLAFVRRTTRARPLERHGETNP